MNPFLFVGIDYGVWSSLRPFSLSMTISAERLLETLTQKLYPQKIIRVAFSKCHENA